MDNLEAMMNDCKMRPHAPLSRSAKLPMLQGNYDAVDPTKCGRLSTTACNAPMLFEHLVLLMMNELPMQRGAGGDDSNDKDKDDYEQWQEMRQRRIKGGTDAVPVFGHGGQLGGPIGFAGRYWDRQLQRFWWRRHGWKRRGGVAGLYKKICLSGGSIKYAQAEGSIGRRFRVDSKSVSDLSRRIRVSETAEYWEKVQRTSARSHVDLVPGRNGTGTRLMCADT
jgi:hypothetical protein